MKRILIIADEKWFNSFTTLLDNHNIFFILATKYEKHHISNKKVLELYYFKTYEEYISYIMEDKNEKNIVFDAIFSEIIKDYSIFSKYAKVIITQLTSQLPNSNKIITYGFNANANVTYSSIVVNQTQQLVICIQNSFKTLYQTQMIEFEFKLQTNKTDSFGLNDLLGIITLALFLDLRFEKNEFINYEKENLYVQ